MYRYGRGQTSNKTLATVSPCVVLQAALSALPVRPTSVPCLFQTRKDKGTEKNRKSAWTFQLGRSNQCPKVEVQGHRTSEPRESEAYCGLCGDLIYCTGGSRRGGAIQPCHPATLTVICNRQYGHIPLWSNMRTWYKYLKKHEIRHLSGKCSHDCQNAFCFRGLCPRDLLIWGSGRCVPGPLWGRNHQVPLYSFWIRQCFTANAADKF